MMAADSLRIIVPSGVSFCWPSPCRRACSASASAPHFALPPAQPSTCRRLASNAAGLRPSPCSPVRWLLVQPCRRAAAAWSGAGGKCGRQDKGRGTCRPAKPVCTWGWRGTQRLRRRAACGARPAPIWACPRASHDGHARACRERSHDRPPRRRFPRPPQRPEEPGPGRFQGAQAGRQGQRRQVLGAPSGGRAAAAGQRPGSRLGRGHTAARFAGRS
jgi:hypothetical protein